MHHFFLFLTKLETLSCLSRESIVQKDSSVVICALQKRKLLRRKHGSWTTRRLSFLKNFGANVYGS